MPRSALITGASRGLGRGIARELAEIGYHLLLNYARNEAAAQDARAECLRVAEQAGHRIQCDLCRADIGVQADRQRLVQEARRLFPALDLLVNNAGVAPLARTDLLEASEESFDRLLNINLKGPFFLTQLVARWMVETSAVPAAQSEPQSRPKIIFISSISAYTASLTRAEYCVAKAGLAMLTPLYATRLADHGINVYELRPGIMATDMTEPVKDRYDGLIREGLTPLRRWGTPRDVGRAVAAIAQDHFPFSTGEIINVDGGFHLRRL